MTDKQRAAKVLELLAERYPDLETHLIAENPWELLVATVLAAQCTDRRVNQVTPELFRRWPDPAALAQATIPELEEVIHSVGFYHSKAKHLIAAAQIVVKEFNGKTPNTMKDLIKLPGVARKTANVVLWGGFGINEGLASCSRNPNGATSTIGWYGSAAMSAMRGSPCVTSARWLRSAPR